MIRPEAVKLCEGCQRQTQAVVGAEKLPRWTIAVEMFRSSVLLGAADVPPLKANGENGMPKTSDSLAASDADLISWNSTLSALEKGNPTVASQELADWEAWELALALLKAAEQQHLALSKVTFNATIAAVSRGTRWEECLRLAAAMRGAFHRPDFITFNALAAVVPALEIVSGLDAGMGPSAWHHLSRRELRPAVHREPHLDRDSEQDFAFFENSLPAEVRLSCGKKGLAQF
ncbi:hypothetical protein AK812_SmicGene25239 [Symbiodinium microadriaticum]|uniref:Pentatricopeptide repeat-containing protein, chloroplastic n=1 Tax=Symbiodinium microadriaticum TaxID=2951 RepID=A0A1Q9DCH5_SYMMI|nr:hypothetical protein AK812_SmicGene25239 [Symbiodinium microadriaticum]